MLSFDAIKPMLTEMANRAALELTGDCAEVQTLIGIGDLAFGVWHDYRETLGVGVKIIKGRALLGDLAFMEGVAAGSVSINIVAIPCRSAEQAEALAQTSGENNH